MRNKNTKTMKNYKVTCKSENQSWIPSFEQWKIKLIPSEKYEVFAMNNGFQIVVKGKFINELDQVKTLKRTFNKDFCRLNFKYV